MKKIILNVFTFVLLLSFMASPVLADRPARGAEKTPEIKPALTARNQDPPSLAVSETGLYIVQLDDASLTTYMGGIPSLQATSPQVTGANKLDTTAPASLAYKAYLEGKQVDFISRMGASLGRSVEVRFQYLNVLNALAVKVSHEEALALAQMPGVLAVYPDRAREIDTDASPAFMGAPTFWEGEFGQDKHRGEGVIVAMLDTGVNPEHPSFAATDGYGYTHTNPFGAGTYVGVCDPDADDYDVDFPCNDKLIGAYNFYSGPDPQPTSARDWHDHGSHVGSTIAGNKHDAIISELGIPRTISGVAPRANIISYLVCFPSCYDTGIVAATEQALDDGVDVLNYSISGGDDPWDDPVDLAFLEATAAGMFVSTSAGNDGPGASTVAHTGPWNAAVAASTQNRSFANDLSVIAPTAPVDLQNIYALRGENVIISADVEAPIKYDPDNNLGCEDFDSGFFDDSFALIQRGDCPFADKEANARAAGAIGLVVFNNAAGLPIVMGATTGDIPAVMISKDDGEALKDYILDHPDTTEILLSATHAVIDDSLGDIMADFSSRGPSQWDLLKPDYTAPGVNILAAGHESEDAYVFMQGTSMASPHAAGAAALMVQRYPTWTPAEIKSALAMTAYQDVLKENGVDPAGYFDMGSGRIDLHEGAQVGLVMNETFANYLAADPHDGGDPKTLNQPSMVDHKCVESCSFTRTVRNVLTDATTYAVTVEAPAGMQVSVVPNNFTIPKDETQELEITVDVDMDVLDPGEWVFGQIELKVATTESAETVATHKLPIAIKPFSESPEITLNPEEISSSQFPGQAVSKTLTIGNTGGVDLEWEIEEEPGITAVLGLTIDGETVDDYPTVAVEGVRAERLDMLTLDSARIEAPQAAQPTAEEDYHLVLDDGTIDTVIGIGGTWEFIFLNRFTPEPWAYPLSLKEIRVVFHNAGNVAVGDEMILVVYENTTGNPDPAIGSNFLASYPVTVVGVPAWNVYTLHEPLVLNGPGDVIIGVIAMEVPGSAYHPAALDTTTPQHRSWIGIWDDWPPPDPPLLPPDDTWMLIDGFRPGNWMIRGLATYDPVCTNPEDVPWLAVDPTAGTTPPAMSTDVLVTLDSTGMSPGNYHANLCITSNDPAKPLSVVPVEMEVVQPCLSVDPESLEKSLRPDQTGTETLHLINICEEPVDFTLIEIDGGYSSPAYLESGTVILSNTGPYNSLPNAAFPMADVELILDDGSRENGIGIGETWEFIFLNRFTPDPGAYPFTLDEIQVYFASQDQVWVGDRMDLVVYENTSGNTDPAVGAQFLARFPVEVEALDAWNTYALPGGVVLDGPGDVLIGVIAMETPGSNYWPAALDQTNSQERSWAGWWLTSPPPVEPTLPPDEEWMLIDDFLPGNWMIRGKGSFGGGDVPWLSENPESGTIPASGEVDITVTFDSTGLDIGDYFAIIRVSSPPAPTIDVPVTMHVVGSSNHAPVAKDQAVTTPFNTPIAISLVATDPDGDVLAYSIVGGPGHGVLEYGMGELPALTYIPNPTWSGVDSFTFKANDGLIDSNIATVTITVGAKPLNKIFLPLIRR